MQIAVLTFDGFNEIDSFVAPAPAGSMVAATATPVHRGRRTQVWQTRIETEDGRLVALVTRTQMVL